MLDVEKLKQEWNDTLLYSWMGLTFTDIDEDGWVVLELDVQKHHRGGGGTEAVNGAVIAYIFDLVGGVAIRAASEGKVKRQVTISLNMQYLELAAAKDKIYAKSRVIRMGGTLAFVESIMVTEDGDVCSRCTGQYRIFKPKDKTHSNIKADIK